MATSPTQKSNTSSKATESTVKSARVSSGTAGHSGAHSEVRSRNLFAAGAALAAAALVAIAIGISGYHKAPVVSKTDKTQTSTQTNAQASQLSTQPLKHTSTVAGSTVTVSLYENSGTETVNAVQSAISYPADKVQLASVKAGDAFPQEAATDTSTPGLIRLARGVTPTTSVSGEQVVATLEFKILQNSASNAVISIDQAASFLVRSSDSQNILGTSPTASLELRQ